MVNKKIITSFTIIIVLMSAILIGSPLSSNIEIINITITIGTIIYIIWNCKKKEESIFSNKIDIFVVLFMISTCIPLIFGTYISLEQTILSIFQNISVTAIYFFIKQVKLEDRSSIENAIILSSIVIFIVGIDNLTTNILGHALQSIGIPYYLNTENRLISNLGYANSVAIIMAFSSFLALGLSLENKSEKKELYYGIANFWYIVGIILAVSKGTMLCFAFFGIIYIILLKEKEYKIEIFVKTIFTTFTAIVYTIIFNELNILQNYIAIWILTLILGIINGLIWILIKKISIHFSRITKKQIITTLISTTILISSVIIYGLYQTEPLTIFSTSKGPDEYTHYIYNVDSNSEYNLKFEISAKSNIQNGYQIQIVEENVYDQKINVHVIDIDNFEGNKEIKFRTDSDTKRLKLRFLRRQKEENSELTIKELTVNGEKITLQYSYLPMPLVQIFEKINLKNKTVWERDVFIIDGMKIAKDNLLFGVGGNGWEYTYGRVQSYGYSTTQSHCFYTQILIENGILGGISILGIIMYIIIYSIKFIKQQKDPAYITILCAIRTFTST